MYARTHVCISTNDVLSQDSNSQSSHCFLPEASARRVIMRPWKYAVPFRPKLFVASEPFKHNVLRMLPSDRNDDRKVTRLDIKEHNSQSSHCFYPEASARRVIMRPWEYAAPFGPKLFVASGPFKTRCAQDAPVRSQ